MELNDYIGTKVVVDYKVSNNKIAYAKGILKSFEDKRLEIEGSTKTWFIHQSMVLACRFSFSDKKSSEPESYLGGEAPE